MRKKRVLTIPRETRICPICGDKFEIRMTLPDKYCCAECYYISKKNKIITPREDRTCPICNNRFEVKITSKKKFCSKKCANINSGKLKIGVIFSEERRKNISKSLIGMVFSQERNKKISKSHKGLKQTKETIEKRIFKLKGQKRTKEFKEKLSKILKGKNTLEWYINKYGNRKGNIKYKEHCKNLSISQTGKKKSPITNEHRKKLSESHKGFKHSEKSKQKMIENFKGMTNKKHSEKTKQSMRISAIKRIEEHHGICIPNFNLQACEFFQQFDKAMETQGQYATCEGEYQIKELGYFLDYFNPQIKLIIEIDEKYHTQPKQKEKDLQRQQGIQKLFPDFEFVRITEEEMNKTLRIKKVI